MAVLCGNADNTVFGSKRSFL